MSDMPSARQHGLYDLRRKRAGLAAGVVFVGSVVSVFVSREMALVSLPFAALLAFLALPSWVGAEPRYPVPSFWAAVRDQMLSFGVPMVGVLLMYLLLNKGELAFAVVILFAVIGVFVYSAYRWQYMRDSMARVRGVGEHMPLLARLWRHYLGYAVGLAAGLGAGLAGGQIHWAVAQGGFVGAFLVGKGVSDLALRQPPIRDRRLSFTLAQLAAMSPVWFGLPWGATATAAWSLSLSAGSSLTWALANNAIIIVYVTVASVVVFTATALVAFLIEVATGEG